MKFYLIAVFAIAPLILAAPPPPPPSDHLTQCLSEVEAAKKLIQTHVPHASNSADQGTVQQKIESYVYKFLSDRVMQTQSELMNGLVNLMSKASSAGSEDGNQAYQWLYDIQTHLGTEMTTVQDRQNNYFRNRLNRVTPLAESSSKDANAYAVERFTAINTEGENLCRKYDTFFNSLLKTGKDLAKAFEQMGKKDSYMDIVKSKGKFVYDQFSEQSDMDLYSYFSSLCSNIPTDATAPALRKKLTEGWSTIAKKYTEKADALKAKLEQDGEEKKGFIAKYKNVSDAQKATWTQLVERAVNDGSKALETRKLLMRRAKLISLKEFDTATKLMPELTKEQYNTCGYEYNDSRLMYTIIGFDTNWKLNIVYKKLNQFTKTAKLA